MHVQLIITLAYTRTSASQPPPAPRAAPPPPEFQPFYLELESGIIIVVTYCCLNSPILARACL